jgi:hypothetical protein
MIRGRLDVTVPPEVEPVSLDEIYSWLRLDPVGSPPVHPDDAMLSSLIKAGRQYVEKATRRALVAQTILYTMVDEPPYPGHAGDGWCGVLPYYQPYYGYVSEVNLPGRYGWNRITLYRPPVIAVLQVSSLDADGTPVVMDPSGYKAVTSGNQPAFIQTVGNAAWPQPGVPGEGLQILYTAGYEGSGSPPDLTDGVPEDLKTAIKLWVQKVYDPTAADMATAYENTIDAICQSYTVYSF